MNLSSAETFDGVSSKPGLMRSGVTTAAVVTSGACIGYEWSIGNEMVTPIVVGKAAELSNNLGGTALATLTGFGVVFLEQTVSAIGTSAAVNRAPRFTNWLHDKIGNRLDGQEMEDAHESWSELGMGTRFTYTMMLGSSFASFREKVIKPAASTKECIKQGINSALIGSSAVGAVTLVAESSTRLAENTDSIRGVDTSWLSTSAEFARDNMYDWRWWTLGLTTKFAYDRIKSFSRKRKAGRQTTAD